MERIPWGAAMRRSQFSLRYDADISSWTAAAYRRLSTGRFNSLVVDRARRTGRLARGIGLLADGGDATIRCSEGLSPRC
jgi:hypothetical protein